MVAKDLNWDDADKARVLGYFSNPKTMTNIEMQIHPKHLSERKAWYKRVTGQELVDGMAGYSKLKTTSDKMSDQMRVYFDQVGKVPDCISSDMIKRQSAGLGKRISRNKLVELMIEHGFQVGDNASLQTFCKVIQKVDPKYHAEVEAGYRMAD